MEFSTCSPDACEEIQQLFTKTFTDSEGLSEGLLIGNLARDLLDSDDHDEIQCFVATEADQIVGCIFFSRLTFERERVNAFLLSPVAVHTDFQGRGIGQKLINFGLNALREEGVTLVLTYGDINFYARVGFHQIDEAVIKAPLKLSFPEGWLGQSLVADEIQALNGNSVCVEALN